MWCVKYLGNNGNNWDADNSEIFWYILSILRALLNTHICGDEYSNKDYDMGYNNAAIFRLSISDVVDTTNGTIHQLPVFLLVSTQFSLVVLI